MTPKSMMASMQDNPGQSLIRLSCSASLPTKYGLAKILSFSAGENSLEDFAVQFGDIDSTKPVPIRIHSSCVTGDAIGSLRCDCGSQLEAALNYFSVRNAGLLIYMNQEGRGIGIANKVRCYSLQDSGLDTVEANEELGFSVDSRTYEISTGIIRCLGITNVQLLTNNPKKLHALSDFGISVERVSLRGELNSFNSGYINTKINKMGHLL